MIQIFLSANKFLGLVHGLCRVLLDLYGRYTLYRFEVYTTRWVHQVALSSRGSRY